MTAPPTTPISPPGQMWRSLSPLGCLYPFLYSVQDMFPTPPEDYDPEEAASLLARYPDQDIPADRRVNVVGVMLEAFCDLTDFPALAEQPAVQAVSCPAPRPGGAVRLRRPADQYLRGRHGGQRVGLSHRLHSARGLPQAH